MIPDHHQLYDTAADREQRKSDPGPLTPGDRAILHEHAITDEIIARCYACSTDRGIDIWWAQASGGVYVTRIADDIRAAHPDGPKYGWPKGQTTFPTMIRPAAGSQLLVVEGCCQHLAAASWAPAGTGVWGLWGCRGLHRKVQLPDLAGIDVWLCLDADAATNDNVAAAVDADARYLLAAGARSVRIIALPATAGEHTGLDDYLARLPENERTAAITALMAAADVYAGQRTSDLLRGEGQGGAGSNGHSSADLREYVPAHFEPLDSRHAARRKLDAETMGWNKASGDWTDAVYDAWRAYAQMLSSASASQLAFTPRVKIPAWVPVAMARWLAGERLLDLDLSDPGYAVLLADETPADIVVHCRWCGREHSSRAFPGAPLGECCPVPAGGKQLLMGVQLLRVRAADGGADLTIPQAAKVINSPLYRATFGLDGCRYASVSGLKEAQRKLQKNGKLEQVKAPARVRSQHRRWRLVEPAVYRVTAPHPDAGTVAELIARVIPRYRQDPPGTPAAPPDGEPSAFSRLSPDQLAFLDEVMAGV